MSTLKVTGLANAHRRNDGYSIAQVRLLKRYPDPPAGTYYSEGGSAVTYTFNNGSVSFAGSNAGWSVTPPAGSGDLYVIYASAVSEEPYDVIQPEEFTPPVILSEESTPGTPGANVCTVFIYKADNGTEAPARPSGVATYTFNGGAISGLNNGWVKDPPAGDKVWVSTATAYSSDATDRIQGTGGEDPCEWSTPKVWKQKGDPGHDPVVTASKSGSTTTISVDGSPIASIEDGAAGVDVTDTSDEYACNDSESTAPQSGWTTFASASANIGPNSRFLWNREVVNYSDGGKDYLTAHIVFKYSEDGKSLKRIENQYAYGGESTAPSSGWDFPELIPNSSNRCVWQRERTVFNTSPETYTDWSNGHMLAMYIKGDKGDSGDTGKEGTNLTLTCDKTTYEIDYRNPTKLKELTFTAYVSGYTFKRATFDGATATGTDGVYKLTKQIQDASTSVTTSFGLIRDKEDSTGEFVFKEISLTIDAVDVTQYNLFYGAISSSSQIMTPSLEGDYFVCLDSFDNNTYLAGHAYRRTNNAWKDDITALNADEQLKCLKNLKDAGYKGVVQLAWFDSLVSENATIKNLNTIVANIVEAEIEEAIIKKLKAGDTTFSGNVNIMDGNSTVFSAQAGDTSKNKTITVTNSGYIDEETQQEVPPQNPDGFLGSEAKAVITSSLNTSSRNNKLYPVSTTLFTADANTKIAYVDVPGASYYPVYGSVESYDEHGNSNTTVDKFFTNEYAVPLTCTFNKHESSVYTTEYYTDIEYTWVRENSYHETFQSESDVPQQGYVYHYTSGGDDYEVRNTAINFIEETSEGYVYSIYEDVYLMEEVQKEYQQDYLGTIEVKKPGSSIYESMDRDFTITLQPNATILFRFNSPDVASLNPDGSTPYEVSNNGYVSIDFNPAQAYGGKTNQVCVYNGTAFSATLDSLFTSDVITDTKHLSINFSGSTYETVFHAYIGTNTAWIPTGDSLHKLYKFRQSTPIVSSFVDSFTPTVGTGIYAIKADNKHITKPSNQALEAVNIQTNSCTLTFESSSGLLSSSDFFRSYGFTFVKKNAPTQVKSQTILPASNSESLGGNGSDEQWQSAYINTMHGNVNTQDTRTQYHVWGAVFN